MSHTSLLCPAFISQICIFFSNFTQSLSTEYGNCFTFNSAKSSYHKHGSIEIQTTGLKGINFLKFIR